MNFPLSYSQMTDAGIAVIPESWKCLTGKKGRGHVVKPV